MQDQTARAIAYIAARLQTGRSSSSVYDYKEGKHTSMSGNVSPNRIAVYDYSAGCHVSGSGSNGNLSLYHYGNAAHISLRHTGKGKFSGFDYASSSHFSVTVQSSSVSFYDYGEGSWRNFSI